MVQRELIVMAVRSILANKGKSFLTMLGIVIGVASVVLIMSVGSGAQSLIFNQIKSVGSNLVGILPGGREEDEQGPPAAALGIVITTLTDDDARAIGDTRNVPYVTAVTSNIDQSMPVTYRGKSRSVIIAGVSWQFTEVHDFTLSDGRFFAEADENAMARVVVIGNATRDYFFGEGEDPLGQSIRIGDINFRIIGVLEDTGSAFFAVDEKLIVPVSTAQKILFGVNHVGVIRAKVDSTEHVQQTVDDIGQLLTKRHNIKEEGREDFTIESQTEVLATLGTVTDALKLFLGAIAAISLVVGGIGIMNIMYVTVTERTREIGLRKALGAPRRIILAQFLTESACIGLLGGVIGTVTGVSLAFLVAVVAQYLGYDWDFIVTVDEVLLASCVSIGVGIVFGYYPARQASKLDPIEALRYE